jgi:hypothetical protein
VARRTSRQQADVKEAADDQNPLRETAEPWSETTRRETLQSALNSV